MLVTVRFVAQLKRVAGTDSDTVTLSDGSSVTGCLECVTSHHADLKRLVFAADGAVQSTILVFVGEEQVDQPAEFPLKDGDVVTLLSPIAGG